MELDDIVLTFDTDWAPDYAINETAHILIESGVKATWFVTHDSPAIQRLFAFPGLFEVGVHPNFLKGSTQGNDYYEIMRYVMQIAPNAKSVRTHGMFYSAAISKMFAVDFGLEIDSSIFLGGMPHIIPYEVSYGGPVLLRIPYFWSDDGEMSISRHPSFRLPEKNFNVPGLKVLCFHPIHVFLNAHTLKTYNEWKRNCRTKTCGKEDAEDWIADGAGAGSLLREIIKQDPNPGGFKTLAEVAREWRGQSACGG